MAPFFHRQSGNVDQSAGDLLYSSAEKNQITPPGVDPIKTNPNFKTIN